MDLDQQSEILCSLSYVQVEYYQNILKSNKVADLLLLPHVKLF